MNKNSLIVALRNLCGVGALLAPVSAWADSPRPAVPGLVQAEGLPREFEGHFFDVPLAVRVDLDGRYLGDAMVVLSRDQRVQLLEFTDTVDSQEPESLRRRWQERLADGRPLGDCQSECVDGLRALHYSLVNSQLSLLTDQAEAAGAANRYHRLPEHGSYGVLLRNQLNLVGDGQQTSGRYALHGQTSLGNWTGVADGQLDRGSDSEQGTRYRVDQLYSERLHDNHFYRLGYFTPGAQGLVRQPRSFGASPDTTLGLMFGSSDSLAIDTAAPSATPIYVTPDRPGVVEIYRNGVLINSQPVQPGLQTLDTRVLPGGIYEVEVRLVEDGQVTSRTQEFIYKPTNWRSSDSRWRYNLYLGRQESLLDNWQEDHEASLGAGVMANYLLHPRAVLGLATQRIDERMQYSTSLDWTPRDRTSLYANLFQTQGYGTGYDLQAIFSHDLGSLVLSHNRSWIEATRNLDGDPVRQQNSQTSLSLNQRLDARHTLTGRVTRSGGEASGMTYDLGWSYFGKLGGSDATWRLSLFDRPGTRATDEQRSRGVNLSLSMSLGQPGKRLSASIGSRTSRDGGRDRNASVSYQQDVDAGALRTLTATTTVDRYGAGLSGHANFESERFYGDAYAQQSSYNSKVSGGINLESMVALGGGKMAMSGQYLPHEAGLIVDVDTDLPDLRLRADDYQGSSARLHPGRNIIPVTAFKSGHVQFDFEDGEHAAVIQPSSVDYHLNRGGVEYRQLHVLRTVTVLGRLLDANGEPMRGALVMNHASRGVSEVDGHFAVEMSEMTPTLEIRSAGAAACLLKLDPAGLPREDNVLLAGDLNCVPSNVAGATEPAKRGES
ncbi:MULTISPECIES: TcfC E-set like domain-containing protein [unclassified Pseudomonas]|uniref:TcfC E-set like domain-containing protein n=1 Tax=unclassified Pseudomonas TaxID=196821 RepID=UPI0035C0F4BF